MRYLSLILLLFISCGIDFPTSYDRIENSMRCLAITYDKAGLAEAAPGDTVSVKAYFAGEHVSSASWLVSTQMLVGALAGSDTFADTIPLEKILVPGTYQEFTNGKTDSIAFDFVVPKNIMQTNFSRINSFNDLFPASIPDTLLSAITKFSPIDFVKLLDTLAVSAEKLNPQTFDLFLSLMTNSNPDTIKQYLPLILQAFTVNIRFNTTVNQDYYVKSYISVRYNNKFKNVLPQVPINRNPIIESINLYTVKGDITSFDPNHDTYEKVSPLQGDNNIIQIDNSHSYFLAIKHPKNCFDYGQEFSTGAYVEEIFRAEWFYKNETIIPDESFDQLMSIKPSMSSNVARIYPSLNKKMVDFGLWAVVYDDLYGEKFRPVGFAFKSIHGKFVYSE